MARPLVVGFLLALALPAGADDLPAGATARFGSPNLRHGDRPLALALTADGSRLVSGGGDGLVKLWDTAAGKLLGSYRVKDGYASSVAVSADGTLIAARFGDNLVHLIDARTMKARRTVPLPNAETVTLSADGKLLAVVTTPGTAHVFETANGLERVQSAAGRAVAFTPNGARLTRAETGEVVRTVDVIGGESLGVCTHLSADGVTGLAYSADGETLLSADAGPTGRIRLWRSGGEKPVAEWVATGGVAAFAQDHVVGLHNKGVAVWDRTGKAVRTFGANVAVLAVSADGTVAATAGSDPHIAVWNVSTGQRSWTDSDDLGAIRELAAATTGEVIVAADRGVAAWTPGEKPTLRQRTPPSSHVVFGDNLIAAVAGRTLVVWRDLSATAPARTVDLGAANSLAACRSGYENFVFVSLDDKTVKQVNPVSGELVRAWEAPSPLPAVAVDPDGMYFAGSGRDGFVRVWALDRNPRVAPQLLWTQRVARSLRPAVAVSPDGKYVAAASIMRTDVFELRTGKRLFFGERTWHDGPFQAVAFSPDGRFVAAGSQGSAGSVLVWEVATGGRVARFEGGGGSVAKLLFLPGYRLVSATADDNLLVWELAPRPKAPATRADLQAAWDKLGDANAAAGFANEQLLAQADPATALAVMSAGVKAVQEARGRIDGLARDLGHAEFARREAAYKGLRDAGAPALAAVAALAEKSGDAEVVQRAEKLLAEFARKGIAQPRYGLYGDDLRIHRAVAAAEQIGGTEGEAALVAIRNARLPGGDGAGAAITRLREKRKAKK